MTTTSTKACSALLMAFVGLSGCTMGYEVPVSSTPSTQAACEAMRPDLPVLYHSQGDTPDTVARIRKANARFNAVCG